MNHTTEIAYIVKLECQKCNRAGKKLILAVRGTRFKAGCSQCQRHLSVHAERYYVMAGFLTIRISEYI